VGKLINDIDQLHQRIDQMENLSTGHPERSAELENGFSDCLLEIIHSETARFDDLEEDLRECLNKGLETTYIPC
jgi:hypothetical protein